MAMNSNNINIPNNSQYSPMLQNLIGKTDIAKPQQNTLNNIPDQRMAATYNIPSKEIYSNQPLNMSSMLAAYMQTQGKTAAAVNRVSMIDSTNNVVWHNNLRTNLRNSKANIMAIIPRTFNAKDTDGNALIQNGEVRGNFVNAIERLDELRDMGINTLHILPVHPTGKSQAMGIAGSLYAPDDFLSIDPNLRDPNTEGTVEDQCKNFINECHKRGISVMLDLPSCASVDFAKRHPELMLFEKNGNDKTPGGWQDIRMFRVFDNEQTRKLNPHLLELHKKYVDMCVNLGFDGIRADVGRAKPAEFWDVIIPYSRSKDPEFGWLAETYTYEDASPQLNMPHDRPTELLKAGFDAYYGQYHIFDQWTKSSNLRQYLNEQIAAQKEYPDKQPRSLIGSFSTHDDQSPMFYGGSPWVQFTSILQSMIPLCNPYFVDGVQTGDYYLYPYEHAIAPETQTDTNECTVHKGRIDIFNPSRKPGGNNPEIGKQITNMLNIRNGRLNEVLTKGSMCWIKPQPDKDEIIAFARQYKGKTVLVVGNRNVNKRNSAVLKLRDIQQGTILNDLTLPYGDKSYFQAKDGELSVDLAPSRIHVFEIDAPNIEKDSFDVSKFVDGVYTKTK